MKISTINLDYNTDLLKYFFYKIKAEFTYHTSFISRFGKHGNKL